MRRIAVLDAPSNLGLRPPSPGTVPGCAKAPGALRDHALVARLRALDAGCVVPPRYDPDGWRPGDGVCQAEEIGEYTARLADRIERITRYGHFPLVLGGDCSILLGAALALRRRRVEEGGRFGLVFIDGHSDFRHAGNAQYIGAAAGEDLALVTGRGQGDLSNIDNLRPYLREEDVVVLGIREHDEYRMDLKAAGILFRTVPQIRAEGPTRSAAWAIEELGRVDGFWIHVDVDVLDPAAMPAVDAPDPGGIAFVELEHIVADLVTRPGCLGLDVTVFDPDYDPDGRYAGEIVQTLVGGLRPVWEHSHPERLPHLEWQLSEHVTGYAVQRAEQDLPREPAADPPPAGAAPEPVGDAPGPAAGEGDPLDARPPRPANHRDSL